MIHCAAEVTRGRAPSATDEKVVKWFTEDAVRDLSRLRESLEKYFLAGMSVTF